MVQRILHDLCLPSLVSKRPVWDTFPGAWYTMAADVVMPNGRTFRSQLITITGINGLGPSISSTRTKTGESVLPSDHIWYVREAARVIGRNAWG